MTAWRDSPTLDIPYTQLKDGEIRLIKFEQPMNNSTAPSIHNKALSNAPPYRALSYRWQNDNDKREPAQFKGHWLDISGGPLVAVQAYLSGFVGSDCQHWFWIDQFCIDQSNVEEKNQQVSMMGDIFHKASETVIFLGFPQGPAAHFRGAFHFLEDVAQLDPPLQNNKADVQEEDAQVGSSFGDTEANIRKLLGSVVERQTLGTISALVAVLSAPWFSRAWVVQEAVLCDASTALCGPLSLDWARFCIAIKRLDKFGYLRNISRDFHTPQHPWQRRVQTLRLFYNLKLTPKHNGALAQEDKPATLCYSEKAMKVLIKLCRTQEATNGSDKVFALAGLCEPEDKPVVDYEQPSEVIYRSLALRMLQEDHTHSGVWDPSCPWNSLGVLALVNADSERIPSPSWVPDWTTPLTYNDLWYDYGKDTGFCASGEQICRPVSSETSPEILVLQGKVCSKVISTGRDSIQTRENRVTAVQATEDLNSLWWEISTSKNEATASERLNQWLLQEGEYLRSNMPEDAQREERIARTLCAGIRFEATSDFVRPGHWQDVKAFAPYWKAYQTYASALSQGNLDSQITAGELQPEEYERCFKAFRIAAGLACRGRKLFITDGQRIGLGPGRMKEGDVISILYGAHWPVVLRPISKQFRFVGYCYVDGIMGGEMIGCTDTPVQDIHIV